MRIEAIELRRVDIPLVTPFRTSFGTQDTRDCVLVRVVTDVGEGWGECVTMPWPLYSAESSDVVIPIVAAHMAPRLLGVDGIGPRDVARLLAPIRGHRMAKAGLEAAVLDAWLRAAGQSFASFLGVTATRVPCGVSVGIHDSTEALVETVGGYLDEGYVRIKLKIEPGNDVEAVAAVRRAFGEDVPLQVDANAAYEPGDIPLLRQLDAFGLLLIEQPFDEERLLANVDLRAAIDTPVCLDESAISAQVVTDAIRLGAVDIVNIKAGRVGGYLEAARIHDLCVAHGVPVWCGGMVETGIGRAANAVLAGMAGFSLPGDNSGFDRFYATDIVADPLRMVDGHLRVPTTPGMGFEVDPEAIEAVTVERVLLEAPSG
ncbi:o-succinylbenzoate synthase [Euzebya pacifica]|uniref:o-succinylbenzoate synthase n=1 Tax=Euzebya pacifica TaxID=1608957 RepID=UPI0030F7060F